MSSLLPDSPGHVDEPERHVHHDRRRHLHVGRIPAPGGVHVSRPRHPILPLHPLWLRAALHLLHGQHEHRVVGHEGDPGVDRPVVWQGEGIPPSHRRRGATAGFGQNKTAITEVTPPVVFHSFPLSVTRVFFFAVRWNHSGVTADMAIPLSYNCGLVAVPRRSLAA